VFSIALICTLTLLATCCAQLAQAAPDSSSSTTDPTNQSFTGCYELNLGRWWPWGFGEDNKYVTSPRLIELLSERGTFGFEQNELLIRAIPRPKAAETGRRRASFWQKKSQREINLFWTDGFTGVTLTLEKNGDELHGWAHPHLDAGEFIPHAARVTARHIPCPAP